MARIPRDVGFWRTILVIVLPVALLPFPILVQDPVAQCAYGLILMALFWILEALPLAVTSLLPVLVFPLLGVVKVGDVCANYIKDTSMFGIGGLSIAIAIERWNLHKRIALRTLLIFGSEPKWLMFGFMLPTWFLSMWVSNTATTAMVIPIVGTVARELRRVKNTENRDNVGFEMETVNNDVTEKYTPLPENGAKDHVNIPENDEFTSSIPVDQTEHKQNEKGEEEEEDEDTPEYLQMCKGMSLCVAYAANIGGTASLSGTGPNLIMQGQTDLVYSSVGLENPINFASWMIFALPMSMIAVVISWFWLQVVFLKWRDILCFQKKQTDMDVRIKATIRKEYDSLGPMTFAEKAVLCHFLVLIILWFSRKPPYGSGWGSLFKEGYVGDSAAAILVLLSLFTFPSQRPAVLCFRRENDTRDHVSVPPILDWPTVEKQFPWGVLLLIGGGYALADACERSGLSQWIGDHLTVFSHLEPWLLVFVLTIAVALLTEVTSNSATATLLMPILARLARTLNFNPLYLMFPTVLATSFAFMLPVATPPNAIVFATGHVQVKDMAKAGIGMNTICLLVLLLATNTWGDAFFDFKTLPDAFRENSVTNTTLNGTLYN